MGEENFRGMRQARSIAGPPATVPASPIAPSRLSRSLPGGQLLGDAVVQGLCLHGGRVDPGDLFVAIRGQRVDGHDHAAEALRRGAAALVVDHVLPLSVPQLVVSSTRAAVGPLAAAFYGDPASKLSVVGVTGTNGKTTTCELVRACLDTTGAPGGQISSTGLHLGPTFRPPSELTTPEAPDLQASLAALVEAGSEGVSVEVSSHSLEFHRVDGIGFDVGVFLGLTPEHLDYHRTMEAYFAAKARLFSPQRCRRAIICTDDEWGRRLASSCPVPATTYGRGPGSDVVYRVESHGLKGVTVILEDRSGTTTIRSRLIGTVNAPNIVGAYLAARAVGVPGPRAQAAIAACGAPPGRFEIVTTDEPFHVVVDYAHTPDALGAIIATARQLAAGRVHLVLGARGERYVQKRADMGRIAARADRVMFATDSPGDEEPRRILEELLAGVPAERRHMASIELDRKTAIRCAVESLEDGDILLLTGRGHEVTQRFADRRVPLDDRVVARFALGARRAAETAQLARPNRRDASVSVVIPVHNAEGTLERALSSVFAQTVPPEEVIVVDDGSTDGSVEVARGFGPTVSIVQQGHLGPSAARNAGMALSRTQWVALLDPDDEWSRFKLERQLRAVGSDDSIVCCAADWTRSRGEVLRPQRPLGCVASPPRTCLSSTLCRPRVCWCGETSSAGWQASSRPWTGPRTGTAGCESRSSVGSSSWMPLLSSITTWPPGAAGTSAGTTPPPWPCSAGRPSIPARSRAKCSPGITSASPSPSIVWGIPKHGRRVWRPSDGIACSHPPFPPPFASWSRSSFTGTLATVRPGRSRIWPADWSAAITSP